MLTSEQINLIAGAMPEWKYQELTRAWMCGLEAVVLIRADGDGVLTKAGAFDIQIEHQMSVENLDDTGSWFMAICGWPPYCGEDECPRTAIAKCLLAKLEAEQ